MLPWLLWPNVFFLAKWCGMEGYFNKKCNEVEFVCACLSIHRRCRNLMMYYFCLLMLSCNPYVRLHILPCREDALLKVLKKCKFVCFNFIFCMGEWVSLAAWTSAASNVLVYLCGFLYTNFSLLAESLWTCVLSWLCQEWLNVLSVRRFPILNS